MCIYEYVYSVWGGMRYIYVCVYGEYMNVCRCVCLCVSVYTVCVGMYCVCMYRYTV